MRKLVFSKLPLTLLLLVLWLPALPARAFEVEDHVRFESALEMEVLKLLSITDLATFEPLIKDYQRLNPTVTVDYTQVSSRELYKAVSAQEEPFDLAISFAMDLQMKLANDGLSQPYQSRISRAAPAWSRWRHEVFGFTAEPIVAVISESGFDGLTLPQTRQELIALMRENPDRFSGKVGTYDIRTVGTGYLLGTQDANSSEAYWRLAEVMGSLDPQLYCCSSQMIDDIRDGDLLLAYNVLESYARSRLQEEDDAQILRMQDFTHVALRSALIPVNAENPDLGGSFIDYLLGPNGQAMLERETDFPPLSSYDAASSGPLRPIRFGVTLLANLDRLMRDRFIGAWEGALRLK
ncbi:Bacterial extracellular solute-binding protein [Thalassovita autumnalis]|uniref:Bacterial extracellular solute-binding protein n=1 Tax=Thalassovita autumnalis TaxID=2072972 RepID=A0A0P1F4R5_9RHOB|nr:extracellular solute-binding protein [Thalassovita autumnalis]CUH62766.1 Bacterial extracellular solute-binding protein [Thalassovita autumnalis]CUH73523.1 Bacterial extracellular solute-binding protein [Thalassovita autumnalis]